VCQPIVCGGHSIVCVRTLRNQLPLILSITFSEFRKMKEIRSTEDTDVAHWQCVP
jgi:hypothetical protein